MWRQDVDQFKFKEGEVFSICGEFQLDNYPKDKEPKNIKLTEKTAIFRVRDPQKIQQFENVCLSYASDDVEEIVGTLEFFEDAERYKVFEILFKIFKTKL